MDVKLIVHVNETWTGLHFANTSDMVIACFFRENFAGLIKLTGIALLNLRFPYPTREDHTKVKHMQFHSFPLTQACVYNGPVFWTFCTWAAA